MSSRRAARALTLRMSCFLLPILLPALIFEVALWRLGESWPIAWVVRAQDDRPSLYGRRYLSQQFGLYKQRMIARRAPRILILGSSRVQQLRARAFPPFEDQVYNAGGLLQHLGDLRQFVDAIRQGALPAPEIAIIGVDPWWLKQTGKPPPTGWSATNSSRDAALRLSEHRRLARALLRREYTLPLAALRLGALAPPATGGLSAIGASALAGQGFRPDGSYQYHPRDLIADSRPPRYVDREQPPVIERIAATSHQFAPTTGIDPAALDLLLTSLTDLVALDVEVYALLPPFADVCFEALDRSAPLRAWWRSYVEQVPGHLEAAGIVTLPVTRPRDWGLDDTFMLDGFHSGEVLSARLLLGLIERAPPASRLSRLDSEALRATIEQAEVPFFFELPALPVMPAGDLR